MFLPHKYMHSSIIAAIEIYESVHLAYYLLHILLHIKHFIIYFIVYIIKVDLKSTTPWNAKFSV